MSMTVDWKGNEGFSQNLRALASEFPGHVAKSLYKEAQMLMTEAKRRTPVDTGNLKSSGHVSKPQIKAGDVSVSLGFGGPAGVGNQAHDTNKEDVHYALYVHEIFAHHGVGQWKYLESVLNEHAKSSPDRICRRAFGESVGRLPNLRHGTSGVIASLVGDGFDPFADAGIGPG
jgi:hypothetical protein